MGFGNKQLMLVPKDQWVGRLSELKIAIHMQYMSQSELKITIHVTYV